MVKSFIEISALILCILLASCGPGPNDEPPLHDAAFRGNVERVKELLATGIDVDSHNSESATPLHWAAFKGREDVARLLIRRGADVNALTTKGSTPLRLATTHKNEALISLLKSRGGEI